MLQALSVAATVVGAGDEFQDLNADGENECIKWTHACGTVHRLERIHRTSSPTLLAAASAIRSGENVVRGGDFRFSAVPVHHLAAAFAALRLATRGTRNVAFITPTGPSTAPFVRDTIGKLSTSVIHLKKLNRDVGPFPIIWEAGAGDEEEAIASAIQLPSDDAIVGIDDLNLDFAMTGVQSVRDAVHKLTALTGQRQYACSRIRLEIKKAVHRTRSWGTSERGTLHAMTVYQAKNREFRGVIILWPYQVYGSTEKQRRLLYNAVTRAKEWVEILVQGSPARLLAPPFTSTPVAAQLAASTARAPRRKTR